jgi:hypothetical protein
LFSEQFIFKKNSGEEKHYPCHSDQTLTTRLLLRLFTFNSSHSFRCSAPSRRLLTIPTCVARRQEHRAFCRGVVISTQQHVQADRISAQLRWYTRFDYLFERCVHSNIRVECVSYVTCLYGAGCCATLFCSIVTDLLKALLGNGSVNTFQHTRGQQ